MGSDLEGKTISPILKKLLIITVLSILHFKLQNMRKPLKNFFFWMNRFNRLHITAQATQLIKQRANITAILFWNFFMIKPARHERIVIPTDFRYVGLISWVCQTCLRSSYRLILVWQIIRKSGGISVTAGVCDAFIVSFFFSAISSRHFCDSVTMRVCAYMRFCTHVVEGKTYMLVHMKGSYEVQW